MKFLGSPNNCHIGCSKTLCTPTYFLMYKNIRSLKNLEFNDEVGYHLLSYPSLKTTGKSPKWTFPTPTSIFLSLCHFSWLLVSRCHKYASYRVSQFQSILLAGFSCLQVVFTIKHYAMALTLFQVEITVIHQISNILNCLPVSSYLHIQGCNLKYIFLNTPIYQYSR